MFRYFGESDNFYIRSMGKLLLVRGLATSDIEANYMSERHPNLAVVAEYGGIIFMADKNDNGVSENSMIARLLKALKPFAQMAEGRDGWPIDDGCGTFPSVRMVRAARDAVKAVEG